MGKDEFQVPSSSNGMYGVEIHATVVGNLIDRTWLRRFSEETEQILVCLSIFLIASYAMRAPTPLTLGIIFTLVGCSLVAAYIGFAYYNFWTAGLGTVVTATVFVAGLSIIYFFRRAEGYKRYLAKTFSFEREKEL